LALLGSAALGFSLAALTALLTVVLARLFLKAGVDDMAGASAGPLWLLPIRDLVSFGVFVASLINMDINWRGDRFRIGKDGVISQVSG
jgi:ceramide glucosyltransferase